MQTIHWPRARPCLNIHCRSGASASDCPPSVSHYSRLVGRAPSWNSNTAPGPRNAGTDCSQFFDQHIYPNETAMSRKWRRTAGAATPSRRLTAHRGAEAARARRAVCGTCSCRDRRARRKACRTSSTRRCARSWAAYRGRRSVQLLGAGHRQHGNDRALRHGGAEGHWLEPLLAGQDSFGVPDDGAGRRFVRRHQHRVQHPPRGNEYVINGRKWWSSGANDPRCKLLHRHGQDQSGSGPPSNSSR